ncbi:sulfotransferase 1C4-like [Liolophura sinensis]|uniref:sulfotransferase 1C4-like n=1 Tax=Liolophura sinensis TaxID=3198878 RepID=UPI00315815F7
MACKTSLNHIFPVGFRWLERTGKLCTRFHRGFSHEWVVLCKSLRPVNFGCNHGNEVLVTGRQNRQLAVIHPGYRCAQLHAHQNKVQQIRTLVTMVTNMNQTTAASFRSWHWSQMNERKQLGSSFGLRQASSAMATKKKRKWPRYLAKGFLIILGSITAFVAYKFYDLKKRGVKPFYIPNLPLQFYGPCGSYKGITITTALLHSIERAQDFEARRDDVFVISFPRSGTTWTQEVVYLISNEADVSKANSRNMEDRFPYLEDPESKVDALNAMESPRFIKTHLPYRLLPPSVHEQKPKIIYVMRNPKDVIVSGYHLWRNFRAGYQGSCMEFSELFLQDKMLFSPWVDHVREFWKRRNDENILFVTYEDLATNLSHEVEKIAKFLNKPLSREQVATIVDHCSFDSMKKNDKVNYRWWDDRGFTNNIGTGFIRKGKVGDWKNFFTPEMDKRVLAKVEKPLTDIGLNVIYEVDSGHGEN